MWRKSNFRNGSSGCVEVDYRKASASTGNGECVEVGVCSCGDQVWVRDSKLGDDSAVIKFEAGEWQVFVSAFGNGMDGEYGSPARLERGPGGVWHLWHEDRPDVVLVFDGAEIAAFTAGVRAGEFDVHDTDASGAVAPSAPPVATLAGEPAS